MIIVYAGTITVDPGIRDRYIAARLEQTTLYRAQPGVQDALAAHHAMHERLLDIPVLSYDLYRYDATRSPMIVS